MKHNWEYKNFGSLCNIVRGGSPRPIQDYLTDATDGLNWIKIGDVAAGSKYITSTKERIKKEGLVKTRQVFKGDFILSNSMSFGRPYILKIDGCIHDGWLAIKGVENHFTADFLYYYLSSPSTYLLFEKLVKGGVVSNLNSDIVKGIDVPVPPIEVQQQIVAELDKINEVIADCRELLRNLDALAQSLFYDYFGDPVTNPKGWEVKNLVDICDAISTGITYKPDNVADKGTIVLRSGNIQNSAFVLDDIVRIDMPLKPFQYVKKNDILMCSRNGSARLVGKVALIPELNEDMSWGAFMTIIRSDFYHFLFQYCRLPAFREQLTKTKTTTVNQITIGMLKKIQLPVPPLELQEKFAERIEQIDAQKKTVEETIANLQTLLDSRMDYWFN